MSKIRKQIPKAIRTDVLFLSDRTCCICHIRGKAIQIHHIDEDPSNNAFENLAVLCPECHNEAHIDGGFAQKLDARLVTRYRDEWLNDVKFRRDSANEKAIKIQVGKVSIGDQVEAIPDTKSPQQSEIKRPPVDYINSLPTFKFTLQQQVQPKRDIGITSEMVQANYDYIDSLTGILVMLANYYSAKQFEDQSPQEFFSEIIASRFRWHYTVAEPLGPATGGTIIKILCSASVAYDIEKMIEDMVLALVGFNDDFDLSGWKKSWRDS